MFKASNQVLRKHMAIIHHHRQPRLPILSIPVFTSLRLMAPPALTIPSADLPHNNGPPLKRTLGRAHRRRQPSTRWRFPSTARLQASGSLGALHRLRRRSGHNPPDSLRNFLDLSQKTCLAIGNPHRALSRRHLLLILSQMPHSMAPHQQPQVSSAPTPVVGSDFHRAPTPAMSPPPPHYYANVGPGTGTASPRPPSRAPSIAPSHSPSPSVHGVQTTPQPGPASGHAQGPGTASYTPAAFPVKPQAYPAQTAPTGSHPAQPSAIPSMPSFAPPPQKLGKHSGASTSLQGFASSVFSKDTVRWSKKTASRFGGAIKHAASSAHAAATNAQSAAIQANALQRQKSMAAAQMKATATTAGQPIPAPVPGQGPPPVVHAQTWPVQAGGNPGVPTSHAPVPPAPSVHPVPPQNPIPQPAPQAVGGAPQPVPQGPTQGSNLAIPSHCSLVCQKAQLLQPRSLVLLELPFPQPLNQVRSLLAVLKLLVTFRDQQASRDLQIRRLSIKATVLSLGLPAMRRLPVPAHPLLSLNRSLASRLAPLCRWFRGLVKESQLNRLNRHPSLSSHGAPHQPKGGSLSNPWCRLQDRMCSISRLPSNLPIPEHTRRLNRRSSCFSLLNSINNPVHSSHPSPSRLIGWQQPAPRWTSQPQQQQTWSPVTIQGAPPYTQPQPQPQPQLQPQLQPQSQPQAQQYHQQQQIQSQAPHQQPGTTWNTPYQQPQTWPQYPGPNPTPAAQPVQYASAPSQAPGPSIQPNMPYPPQGCLPPSQGPAPAQQPQWQGQPYAQPANMVQQQIPPPQLNVVQQPASLPIAAPGSQQVPHTAPVNPVNNLETQPAGSPTPIAAVAPVSNEPVQASAATGSSSDRADGAKVFSEKGPSQTAEEDVMNSGAQDNSTSVDAFNTQEAQNSSRPSTFSANIQNRTLANMSRRNILLCFDAFGTLFYPKPSVPEQYASVARQCGLASVTAEQVKASFKVAYSAAQKAHPNYGKSTGMGAERWWTDVIQNTFQLITSSPKEALPKDLAPRLLHRFMSSEGYAMVPGVATLLRSLKEQQHHKQRRGHPRILVGVITNSDDRVPSVLSSFGLRVSPARFGTPFDAAELARRQQGQPYDVDLHCMSYDVGVGKPDRRIFDAAVGMADELATAAAAVESAAAEGDADPGHSPWLKIYIGDEYLKDVVGSREAGWHPVYVGTEDELPDQERFVNLKQLGHVKTLDEAFPENDSPGTIQAQSTQEFLEWLIERYHSKEV
ncbi:hypothetical protein VTJ49DRAFT_4218 [Mycothermus thermophilus]|uniref:Haloacid dehalogenase n=1 Tax=Humicola insolens TaxID=85995 RepID=A0ABR3V5V5_HUMIN